MNPWNRRREARLACQTDQCWQMAALGAVSTVVLAVIVGWVAYLAGRVVGLL